MDPIQPSLSSLSRRPYRGAKGKEWSELNLRLALGGARLWLIAGTGRSSPLTSMPGVLRHHGPGRVLSAAAHKGEAYGSGRAFAVRAEFDPNQPCAALPSKV